MSLFDSLTFVVETDPRYPAAICNLHAIPEKFTLKWGGTPTPDHLTHAEFLREIILNWNEDDEDGI